MIRIVLQRNYSAIFFVLVFTCFVAAAFAASAGGAASAQTRAQANIEGRDHLVFFLPSKESAIFKQIDTLCKTIGDKIGIPLKMMTAAEIPIKNPTIPQLAKWAKGQASRKAIDITVGTPTSLYSMMDEGIKFIPIATYEIDKKKTDKACLFVKRGSPYTKLAGDSEKLAALKGKKIGIGHGIRSNPVADMLLLDYGINTQSTKYFDLVGSFGGAEDKLKDTVAGNIEGFITLKVDLKFLFNKNKEYATSIEPLICGKEYANMPLIVREDLDPAIVEKIKKIFLGMHKDRDFSQIHFLFYAINGHFAPVTMADYTNWETIYRKGRKEGWLDDLGQMIMPGD